MTPDTGMKLVLLAGTMTFGNEWYQTRTVNWRIPVATVLAAAATAGVGRLSPGGAASIGVMALIAAAATPFPAKTGKSPIQTLNSIIATPANAKPSTTTPQPGSLQAANQQVA